MIQPTYKSVRSSLWHFKMFFELKITKNNEIRLGWLEKSDVPWEPNFLRGISPTLSQRQRYLFIYLLVFVYESEVLVTWLLVWVCRREKTGIQYTDCVPFMFRGRLFLFSAVGFLLILKFFRVLLIVHKVSRSRFPFWCFRWVHLSLNFLYKLKFWLQNIPIDRRKPITFASVVSNLRLFFRYFFTCLEQKIVLSQQLVGLIHKPTVIALDLSVWCKLCQLL